ncbi:MAG: calcium-binding protein, partial [Gammaproteobacteria bacterium]
VTVSMRGGDDNVVGSDQNDSISGGEGENKLDGGDGDDRIYSHKGGTDDISGGAGNDYIYTDGQDKIDGGEGSDRVYTYGEEDISLNMGEANVESVYAQTDADHKIDASTSDEQVVVRTKGGDDEIIGSDHNDNLGGGAGNDVIEGGDGNDHLYGQDGDDKLIGGDGDDRLYGESGDDIIVIGEGNDNAYGGDGSDLFLLDSLDGNDVIHGGTGEGWTDVLQIDVSSKEAGDENNPWSIEVNGESVEFSMEDGGLDMGTDASGVISFADGTEVVFDGVEQIQW